MAKAIITTDKIEVGSKWSEVEGKYTHVVETVLEKTYRSVLVTRQKRTDKGIYCTNWFTADDFYEQFKQVK